MRRAGGAVHWRVRWRQGDRYRPQTFDRKGDAVTFAAEIRRRQQLGTLVTIDSGRETLRDYVVDTWAPAYGSKLARKTQLHYQHLILKHVLPELARSSCARSRRRRLPAGRPIGSQLVTVASYQSWRRRAFKHSLDGAGVEHARPYDLRHSYASLLLHEGRSVIYVARQLGHDARLTLSTYGHVMDEFEEAPQLDAHTAIADARAALANEEPELRRL